ncbi:hypothetical protein HRR83_003376 [Exophiala dermatitidis]|uniref:Uncharacterized protein n=2 Tax=Exophiala dermatitidis TaxID=5970 RepID=H6BMI1_EXODN|nr:uncharacterized protein HMPREF1120_00282 [Exophiala dermatitidis NIH/UT8656]KAJ4514723.1 hypothetical protein HRR75_004087 [Exophiala dermatitidis]EHY52063.1 hypothetical protein HMPREF1120_00282 [Exophiala dermatitidis NIH/UT8656]KAJ4518170.1 hypothetical protein HRR74_004465 [Exophiala dermatitidis]KAJ4521068.1 hypothetical protein HRR73_003409 [Exophiala dermatitidis]KAJ4547651.1 hypothetical protein HRR76_000283 [Exophiala dermatitidis]
MIPWSSLSSSEVCPDWRIELNEHNLSHYVDKGGPSPLDDSMNVRMLESAHERRFAIAQLGVSNAAFEAGHRARIEYMFYRTKSHFTAHALDERFHPDTSLLADLYLFDFQLSVDHYNAYEPLPSDLAVVDDSGDDAASASGLGGPDTTRASGSGTDTTSSSMGPPTRTAATTSTPTTTALPTPPTPVGITTPAPASAPAPCKPLVLTSHLTLHQLMNPEPEAEPVPGPAGTKLQSHQSESKPKPKPQPRPIPDQSRKRKHKSKSMPSPTFTTLRGIDKNMKTVGSFTGATAATTTNTASAAYPAYTAPPTTSVVSVKDILVPVPETTSEEDEDADEDGQKRGKEKKKKKKPSQERAGTRTISFARANKVPTLKQASRTRRETRMRKSDKKGDTGDGNGYENGRGIYIRGHTT